MAETIAQNERLTIERLPLGAYDNNVYLISCRRTGETLIVDAPSPWQEIQRALGSRNPVAIVITHSHSDHTGGLVALTKALGVPVAAHPADIGQIPGEVAQPLNDGDTIDVGDLRVRVLHTPGHSPGSICLLIDGYLISGDTLFPGGPGNTRNNQKDFAQIIESIRTRLFTLPDETPVYPGHGRDTTIGAERPHLQEWIQRGW